MVQDNKTLHEEAEKNEEERKEENTLKKPRLDLHQYSELTRVSEYGVFASLTAIYGRVSVPRNLSYLYCGVVEEFCEFKSAARTLEKLQTEQGSGDIGAEQGSGDVGAEQGSGDIGAELEDGDVGTARLAVLKELGDVTWYLSAMCNELELKLDDVVSEEKVTEEDSTPDLSELLDQVLRNVGTIGGKVKKAIRDDQEEMTSEKRGTIERCIREIFRVIQHDLCPRYSSSILEVMRLNAKKAASRFARGVVQGDGDDR